MSREAPSIVGLREAGAVHLPRRLDFQAIADDLHAIQDCAAELGAALGKDVFLPGTDGYELARSSLFVIDAARRAPCCVIQPRSTDAVSTAVRIASEHGVGVTVRGGGLSANCAADGAVMVDLSAHLGGGQLVGAEARIGGGARMRTLLDTLSAAGRTVPIGISPLAGLGLATSGGIGYLTRSLGLTLDYLAAVELVVASGEVLELSDRSEGGKGSLWWGVRGSAPQFGVVVAATFRSVPGVDVFVHRLVLPLDAAAAYFEVACGLPAETSMSAVMGTPPGGEEPALFLYTAHAGADRPGVEEARQAGHQVAATGGVKPSFEDEGVFRYMAGGMPEMAPPGIDGAEPPGPELPSPGGPRVGFRGANRFVGDLGPDAALALAERARATPTRMCRIDFQHTGGVMRSGSEGGMSFLGRDQEWSIPLNAIWSDEADRAACVGWIEGTLDVLDRYALGMYSVELRPGLPDTEREVALCFGEHLPRLRALKESWDPDNTFRGSFPL